MGAEVRERARAPGEVVAVEAALPRGLHETAALARDVDERERVRVAEHRGDDAGRGRHGEREMDGADCARRSRPDAAARSARGTSRERAGEGDDEQVGDGRPRRRARALGPGSTPVGHELAADVDVRDLLPARGDVRHDGLRGAGRRRGRGRRPAGGSAMSRATIRPPGPEPCSVRELDSSLAREPAGSRRGDRPEPRPRAPRRWAWMGWQPPSTAPRARARRRRAPAAAAGDGLDLRQHARRPPRSRPRRRRSAGRRRRAPRSRPSPCRSRPRR